MIHGCMTSDVISALVRGLHTAGVLPYHLIHIEHCCDCENHAMTTWHIPESYEKRVSEVKRALKSYIPPTLVYSNTLRRLPGDEKTTDNHMARIGAFEVVLRPYFSTLSMSVYSKLNQKVMPQVSDIIDVCSSVVLPEKLQYSRKRIVYVSLFDSYYRTIAKDSRIILFKVNTHHNTTSDALENLVDLKEVQAYSGIRSAISTSVMTDNLDNVAPLPRSVVVSGRVRPASAGSPNKSRGTLPRSPKREQTNQAHDNKRLPPKKSALEERKPTFSEELMKSEAVQDYIFRHSLAYYRVRCWSHFEVDLWLKSHGVSDQAISNAHASGVEDGASLLALANKVTLRKWGVRAQLTLKKLEASLISIRSSAADFDPVIIEGLPEDGQEKRGYSRASADYISGGTRKNPLFEQYAVSNLSADGSIQFEISVAGTYVLMATSPSTATFCSYAFSCGSSMQYNYTALLKPITVPVYFRILMDDVGSKLLDGVPFATNGLLFSVVNMGCGKRHTGFVNFEEVFEETLTEDGEEPPPSLAVRPPKLQRYNSIVNVLSVNPAANSISRSQSAGVLPSNAGQKHFARAKKRVDTKKTKQRVATSLIWLPIGKYYSEVDGSVFYVKDNDHLKFIRETAPADLMGTTPVETTVADRLIFGGEVREPAIVKCHMRLVKNSIRGFQMIYRRYKKTFLFDKMCAYMVMRRGAKRFCDWARNEVRQKKIIKLQSWLRMTKVLREYKHFWASTVFIQTRLRIVLARLRLRKMKKARKVIYKYIASWYFRLKMKQHTAALIIQMMFRRAAAIKKKDCLIFAKRCKKLFVRYIGRIKAKIRMVNAAKVARGREQDECMFMAREEQHVLKHLQWLKAEQRRLIELRLKAIAKKRDAAATKIQASCRGPLLRMRRHRGIHALIRLQVI